MGSHGIFGVGRVNVSRDVRTDTHFEKCLDGSSNSTQRCVLICRYIYIWLVAFVQQNLENLC